MLMVQTNFGAGNVDCAADQALGERVGNANREKLSSQPASLPRPLLSSLSINRQVRLDASSPHRPSFGELSDDDCRCVIFLDTPIVAV